jgi:hypothetical protein
MSGLFFLEQKNFPVMSQDSGPVILTIAIAPVPGAVEIAAIVSSEFISRLFLQKP